MPGYTAIVHTVLWLTLRSWLALVIVLLLRAGLAVAGVLPYLLILMVLVRSLLAAPVDPTTGLDAPELWWSALRAQPGFWAGVAGFCATLSLLRVVVLTLLEGGLWGGMAAALRAGRGMRAGELLSDGLRLFDRAVIFRLLAELFSLVLRLGLLALPLLWLWLSDADPGEGGVALRLSLVLLPGLVLWALGETLLFSAHLCVMSAAAVDDSRPDAALRAGLRFLRERASALLALGAFFATVAGLWATLRLGGSLWFARLTLLESSGRLLPVGANAWDLSFGMLSLALWVAFIAAVLHLYLDARSRPAALAG